MPSRRSLIILFCLLLTTLGWNQSINMEKLENFKARSIGPAGMSGRVTAIDALHSNPDVIYIGTASGGVWHSESGGIDWKPIFDEQPYANIGALAIDQSNPSIIWVGTGEGNPRNSANSGNGIYKSMDGGKTWLHLGLEGTRNIHRILINPQKPDEVFVGAQGSAWGPSKDRGVFKTNDGGKTWKKILYVNESTGIGELVMDPGNPRKLFAGMWQMRRWPWFFKSGGPGSGLYVTHDGGENWKRLSPENGLPKGELGRMGLAIARSNPKVVYALIESKKNALYRSQDGGEKWTRVADKNIGNRPFYYAEIHVDPANENRLYNLYSVVSVSEDGGKTFRTLIPWNNIHPDHHAWWVHPQNPHLIMEGNDGGMAISRDRGETWRFVENLPLAQFYHINVDNDDPYNVYGGMQDNGSWQGPSLVWRNGGIRNSYWEEVSFGDGFDVVPDPNNSRYGYSMWQGGNLLRYDLKTGHNQYIRPTDPEEVALRFNWNAAIAVDPFNPNGLYYGSQFVHYSEDRGDTWTRISPDLTSNDPEKQKQLESGGLTYDVTQAENFTTLLTIAPSPVEKGVVWAGSDDGNLHLTRDGGKSWQNLSSRLKGVPQGSWIPQIKASRNNAGEALVVVNNYRRDDWTPYLYHSKDFGKTWRRLVREGQVNGYVLSAAQHPDAENLIFLGAEGGLYFSIDWGENWHKWTHGYPTVSTMDMIIHPREKDLIIGTFGRSAYILDDLGPLVELAKEGGSLLDEPLRLFPIPEATLASYRQGSGGRFVGDEAYAGQNKPYGAMISFVYNAQKDSSGQKGDPLKMEIFNLNKDIIRTVTLKPDSGFNRVFWRLNQKGVRWPGTEKPKKKDAPEPSGNAVLPGSYQVRLSSGDWVDSAMVNVRMDPRLTVNEAVLVRRNDLLEALMDKRALATEAADRLRDSREVIETIHKLLGDREDDLAKGVRKEGKALQDSIKQMMTHILNAEKQGIYRDPNTLSAKLSRAQSYTSWAWHISEPAVEAAAKHAERRLDEVVKTVNRFLAGPWQRYQEGVEQADIKLFKKYSPMAR